MIHHVLEHVANEKYSKHETSSGECNALVDYSLPNKRQYINRGCGTSGTGKWCNVYASLWIKKKEK